MGLNQTLAQMRASARDFGNFKGATALLRHPDAAMNDAINVALGSLRRKLDEVDSGQRWLASTTITTANGTATYSLPVTFEHLISVDLSANGVRSWLTAFEMHERPSLLSPTSPSAGTPFCYRVEGSNIEYLPTPSGIYTSLLWFIPSAQQFATGGSDDAVTFDTLNRLDEYVIAYAVRLRATKDKNWDLVNECRTLCAQLEAVEDRARRFEYAVLEVDALR